VTGTNGKTTTAALTAHVLEVDGMTVGLGGNIGAAFGPPASTLAMLEPVPDWFVLELSSFQLAATDQLKPAIGVVTNLAPDHLDRYSGVAEYYADKQRLFANADESSQWVLGDQQEVAALAGRAPGRRTTFSLRPMPAPSAYLQDDCLTLNLETPEAVAELGELKILGRHNACNALAACLAGALAGASVDGLRRGLTSFAPLPHRTEAVGRIDDVLWVNDSKATNVAAARSAMESLDGPLVVLLGGSDKGESFAPLAEPLKRRARAAVVYGEARKRLREELADVPCVEVCDGSFDSAVALGAARANAGDTLLLSPATSSYDMFRNYEERGDRFRALARERQ